MNGKKQWKKFNCKTLMDYFVVYLKTDVLLLADIFQKFREMSFANYGLDPAWFYNAPGLAYCAALKITKVSLELISDPNMYLGPVV
jgi:hypothetical protein